MLPNSLLVIAIAGIATACSSPAPRASAPRVAVAPAPASAASLYLTAQHAALIHAYYGTAGNPGKGRGKGRNGGLPPGIAKNLERGKPLPPGIAKQYLPADLLRQLPPARSGFQYVVVAGKLLLVEAATQIIHDILLESVFG